ncbi:MAG: hypothetical protein HY674_12115, partial [Chloroflexi bacterium]|nr:hypothetical protein [Chloroflexota bacterium]
SQISSGGRVKDFKAPATDPQGRKSILRGQDARQVAKGVFEVTKPRLEMYRSDEQLDMIIEAPQCLFESQSKIASSTQKISVRTADEKFSIQGEGFQWNPADSHLLISNQVHAVIRKAILTSPPPALKAAAPPAVGQGRPTLQTNLDVIEVFSDQFDSRSGQAVFRGQVRAADSQMRLNCETLAIHRSANGTLEKIVANRNVTILTLQDQSRATCDEAVYTVNEQSDLLELSGNAAWQDGVRESKAERFFFDRKRDLLRAVGRASLKLPLDAMSQPAFLSATPARTAAWPAATNQFFEIQADFLTLSNGPPISFLAETNVVILSEDKKSRATGDQASYSEATGVIQLSGRPEWQSDRRVVKGQTLIFDRTNRVFRAQGKAYLKFPLPASQNAALRRAPATIPPEHRPAATNLFVEVFSNDLDYQSDLLTFHENVRANYLEGEQVGGSLTCNLLTVKVSNQVERLEAKGRVAVEAVPRLTSAGKTVGRQLHCERLTVALSTNGQIQTIVAEQEVLAQQNEIRPGKAKPVLTSLKSDALTAHFFKETNQVERMLAEGGVEIVQGERSARGAQATYTGENNRVELTGRPTARLPEGEITAADVLVWDRANDRFLAKGKFRSRWTRWPGQTNQSNLHISR